MTELLERIVGISPMLPACVECERRSLEINPSFRCVLKEALSTNEDLVSEAEECSGAVAIAHHLGGAVVRTVQTPWEHHRIRGPLTKIGKKLIFSRQSSCESVHDRDEDGQSKCEITSLKD